MGDMADDFRFMKEHRQEQRQRVEPMRLEHAQRRLQDEGYTVTTSLKDSKALMVDDYVTFWPFSGWYSGKGIGSGRGLNHLIKSLKAKG